VTMTFLGIYFAIGLVVSLVVLVMIRLAAEGDSRVTDNETEPRRFYLEIMDPAVPLGTTGDL